MKKITIFALSALFATTLFAQKDSLNAVVKVENEYNPIIVKAIKPSFTPQVENTSGNAPLDLVFSRSATPFERFVSSRDIKKLLPTQEQSYDGYARLGYGLKGWLDAKVGYRLNVAPNDKIDIFASLTGFNSDVDGLAGPEWKSRFYNTWLMADYTHTFSTMTLNVTGSINNNLFNYQPSGLIAAGVDKQNASSYNLLANIESKSMSSISYKANLGYKLGTRKYSTAQEERTSENHFIAGGEFACEIDNEQLRNLGVAVDFDAFNYNDAMKPQYYEYDNYISVRTNPFMNFRFDDWKLRVGIHADVLTANGKKVAFAPDVKLEGALTDNLTFYTAITGGNTLNGFEKLGELSPYWGYRTGDEQLTPTYKVFDVNSGMRVTFNPIAVNLYIGYDYEKYNLLPIVSIADPTGLVYTDFLQDDTRKFYIGGEVSGDCGGWLDAKADVRYNKWSSDAAAGSLLFAPMLQANLKVRARIIDDLYVGAGYNYARYTKDGGERITDMNNLSADVSYKFHKQLRAYVQADNLLNRDYFDYAGYISRGVAVLLGIECNF